MSLLGTFGEHLCGKRVRPSGSPSLKFFQGGNQMKKHIVSFIVALLTVAYVTQAQTPTAVGDKESGLAAVYSDSLNGHTTASGQRFDQGKMRAAHKTLPFGTKIKVTNMKNNKSVVVRVNDRGPVQAGRILDISQSAAAKIGIPKTAMRDVTLEVIEIGNGKTSHQSGGQ